MGVQNPTYRYRVDPDDRLVWVDEWWIAFGQENGLVEDSFLGRSLWDFVAGDEICRLYAEIHERVRLSGKSVILPFRCDSPALQRHMRLTITPEESGQLLYESLVVSVNPRRFLPVLDSKLPHSRSFLTICSCCGQALLEPTGWMDVEEISVTLRLFETQKVPKLHHTICPACAGVMSSASDDGNAALHP